jgi:hypothetical protein
MVPTEDENVTEFSELSRALSHFQSGMADLWRKLKAIEESHPDGDTVRNSGGDDRDA